MAEALLLIAVGIVLVRLGWGGRRSFAGAGWALAAAGLAATGWIAGAWGCAVGVLAGMAVALGAVLLAGWRSPPRERRVVRRARVTREPVRWPDLGRRLAVFVLVVPGGFVAGEALALAGRRFAYAHGAGEADATVLGWIAQPLAWAVVATVQMTRSGPARMIAPLLAVVASAAALWCAA